TYGKTMVPIVTFGKTMVPLLGKSTPEAEKSPLSGDSSGKTMVQVIGEIVHLMPKYPNWRPSLLDTGIRVKK
nr:hypothetical protein [Dehalococcoidales bacterium]